MEKARVQKFIALSGVCSRRKAEDLIVQGRVKVNGKVIGIGDQCFSSDKIEVDGKKISFDLDDKVYIVLNKKKGFVTTKSDELGRDTVYFLLRKEDRKSNLFSVGRLDKDTSGLLILTNDGDFSQRVIHPSRKIEKEYVLKLDKKLDLKDKLRIEKGLVLDGYKLKSCKILDLKNGKYLIRIFEGRKRQIRRVFEMCSYFVLELERVRIGGLSLDELKLGAGKYKKVSREFLEKKIFV